MMTITKSSRWTKLRALAAVPVIALALLAFANPTIESAPEMVVVAYHPASVNAVQPSQPEAVPVAVPATAEKSVEEQAPEAQPEPQDSRTEVYESVDQMPEFPGGEMEMMKYLSQNIKYPENAAKNDIQGRVVLRFVVEKTGEIGEIKVLRSVDEELDAEAVRVVRSMPNFTPGRKNGKAVAVWYALPISFKLQGDPEKPKTE